MTISLIQRYDPIQNRFPTTNWSLVVAAGNSRLEASKAALESLCALHWPPAYGFVRARGHSVEEALDLTQEFFALVIEGGTLGRADETLGRFGTFLLTLLERFPIHEWKKERAQKRRGNLSILQRLEADYASRDRALEFATYSRGQ